jgi:hypothetical protein
LCFVSPTHSCAPSAYTLAHLAVLTIVHLDGTSILSLYTIKLLSAVCSSKLEHNDAIDGSPKEDTNIISALRPITAAVICQGSVMAMDSQSAPLARGTSTIPVLDDPEMPEQVVEVANNKQE